MSEEVSAPGAGAYPDPQAAAPAAMNAPPRRRRLPANRWLRWLVYAVAGLLALWVLTWAAVPPLLKWQGQKIASEQLGRQVRIGKVDFKPWTLELVLDNVTVAGAGGQGTQLAIGRLYADAALASLWRLVPVVDAVRIEQPVLHLRHDGDGHYDIDDILQRLAARPASPEPSEPQRFAVYNIELTGGAIDFDDRAVGRVHQVRQLDLSVPFVSNLPDERAVKVVPRLGFVVNGSPFGSSAQALPFADSLKTDAAFRLARLDLKPYLGYLPAGLPLRLTAATVDADLKLAFEQTPRPSLRVYGTVDVSGLKSVDVAGREALAFDALQLQLADVRPLEQRVHLAQVALAGPQMALRRDRQGRLNLLLGDATANPDAPEKGAAGARQERAGGQKDAENPASGASVSASASAAASRAAAAPAASAAPNRAPATSSAASAASGAGSAPRPPRTAVPVAPPSWQLQIDHLAVQGGSLDWQDETTAGDGAPAASVRLNALQLTADSVRYPLAETLRFAGSAELADTGAVVRVASQTSPATRKAVSRRGRGNEARATAEPASRTADSAVAEAVPQAAASAPSSAASATPAAGGHTPSLAFKGQVTLQGAEAEANVARVPLGLAGPYLAPYLVPRLSGQLDAQLGLHWAPPKAGEQQPELQVGIEQVTLSDLLLADADTTAAKPRGKARTVRSGAGLADGQLVTVRQVSLKGGRFDWRTRQVNLGQVAVDAPLVDVARDAQGRWMAEAWLRPATGGATAAGQPAPTTKQGAEPSWKLAAEGLKLSGGNIGWRDEVPATPVRAALTQLALEAGPVDLDTLKPVALRLVARVNAGRAEPGRLSWRGDVGLKPVSAQGTVDVHRLPVHAFTAYFDDALNIDILRADTSFKGQVQYADTPQGPRLKLAGDAQLLDWRTNSRPGTAASANSAQDAATSAAGTASTTRRQLGGTTTTVATAPARPVQPADAGAPGRGGSGASQAPIAPTVPTSSAKARGSGLGEELLSFKRLALTGLDVALEPAKPLQLRVKDTLLSDFYARIVIHPNGRINLQDLVKTKDGEAAAAAPPQVAATPAFGMPASGEFNGDATNSAAAAASSARAAPPKADPNAPVMHFGPTRLVNGRIDFSDRFIRPNYSADLTELNGTLGAFSSVAPSTEPQMAELQLTGRAEGTAQLSIDGRLNPLAQPLALDIQGKVRDLDLPPLSPYSVKYAGHGIERGKLSMDVTYKIQPDGRLTASNKLVLNQLSFGEPVAGAPASLPVKLATALLADSHGVIDLDIPISGSLNDPQFSLGPIIVKAIVNLIGKAITAPFRLLAGALGGGGAGGEDMANVAFAPGSAQLSAKAREQLDKVAKALADRPQLKLTVVGTARLSDEGEAWRRERLKAMVAAEKRGEEPAPEAPAEPAVAASAPDSGAGGARPATAGATKSSEAQIGDTEYPVLLKRLYRRADIPGKPRNVLGFAKDVPVEEMEALLLKHIDVSDDTMRQLAVQRGVAVKDYLAGRKLPPERLFLGAARTGQAGAPAPAASAASDAKDAESASAAWSPRAELQLSAR
ncbi:DUF748 domain-containing protein [Ottowia sp.]|uniref:DUF748 domain-containing protein n=1 Tax=Ottowia sp. TaxID=1898956 RepID=UPI002608C6D1|nr:DUF748 domain-containing protein [Ottowia sp.]